MPVPRPALWRYVARDVRVLSRLQSERYSLYEVVRAELDSAPRGGCPMAASASAGRREPGYLPLLSKLGRTFVLRDIELVRRVLGDARTYDRALTLESFADAFRLESVFTTKDARLHHDLKAFFARQTNNLPPAEFARMKEVFDRHVDAMLAEFDGDAPVAFIPKIEGMVLAAYSDAFFGIDEFPDADECALLLKRVWQIKSLRNNVPSRRWDPRLRAEMRRLQRRMFEIVDAAQARADAAGSPVAARMAEVYAANGYPPGNLLNALIPLYEAIARGVVYALVELAGSPDVQEELRREIARGAGDPLAYCAATGTLLNRVWLETLRLRPPTPNQTRRVTAPDGTFPVGSKVVVVWSVFHLDRRVWGADAEEFVPDRWLDVTPEQELHYNPFGMGVQRCVARNYASFGGRVMLARVLGSRLVLPAPGAVAGRGTGADRGYSRGPDPDASLLRFAVPAGRG